jgi:hypothetical protein
LGDAHVSVGRPGGLRAGNPAVRAHLKALPTNYHLDAKDVELLEWTAREELRANKVFRKLVDDLK